MNKTPLVTLVALVALIAGCGGDDKTTSDETKTVSKTEFIEQGDGICKRSIKRIEIESEEFAEDHNFTLKNDHLRKNQLEELYAEVLAPSLNRQADELDALRAPKGDEQQVEEIVVSLQSVAGEIEEDPSRAIPDGVMDEPHELAADYGFKVCGVE